MPCFPLVFPDRRDALKVFGTVDVELDLVPKRTGAPTLGPGSPQFG